MPRQQRKRVLTPNQIVAYNLRRARELREWTQEEAASRLQPFVGALWSKATFSAAERSDRSARVRQFTANDIIAMSRAFDLPIDWFFLPPLEPDVDPTAPFITTTGKPLTASDAARRVAVGETFTAATLLSLIYRADIESAFRVREILNEIPPKHRAELETSVVEHVNIIAAAAINETFGDLAEWERIARNMADMFGAVRRRYMADLQAEITNAEGQLSRLKDEAEDQLSNTLKERAAKRRQKA